jgi:FkbM family methyltransferase
MSISIIELESRGFKWTLPLNDVLTKPFLSAEDHEPHLTKFIDLFLKEGDVAVDIGACFGFHTLHMSRKVGHSGKVYAFEPQHEMYDLLKTNLLDNDCLRNTTVHNVALGDVTMEVCMYNAYPDTTTNWGDSFISWKYRNENYNSYDDLQELEKIGKGGQNLDLTKRNVYCNTLDSFILEYPVKFMKIDVQGFELMVLQGGEKFIAEHRPVMIIEFEDNCMKFHGYTTKELVQYLTDINYEVLLLDNPYPCDHVCVPREKLYEFYQQFKGKIHPHTQNNSINNNVVNGVNKRLTL